MGEIKTLKDIFKGMDLNTFGDWEALSVELSKREKKVRISAKCNEVPDFKVLGETEKAISAKFNLEDTYIFPNYAGPCLSDDEILGKTEDILFRTFKFYPGLCGILKDSVFEMKENGIFVKLKNTGSDILKVRGADKFLERIIRESYGKAGKVVFLDRADSGEHSVPSQEEDYQYFEPPAVTAEIQQALSQSKKAEEKTVTVEIPEDSAIILGRKKFTDEIIPMTAVTVDSDKVAIEGNVFAVDSREIRSGKILVMFDMTDLSYSLSVKFFVEKPKFEYISEKLKPGIWVRVAGTAQYDKFTQEVSIFATGIYQVEHRERMDTAEEKRTELHLHTQMSTMDGVSSPASLIKRAASWGHSAIAITDHGVLQGYPEAFAAGKKHGIKIIYGVEGYLLDDTGVTITNENIKNYKTTHIILLVKNYVGLKNLYRLVSESHLNYFYKKPRMLKSLIAKYREGLIISSACEAGDLYRAIVGHEPEERIEEIASFYDYLEIQPVGNNAYMIPAKMAKDEDEIREFNKKVVALGEKLNKPVVATGDVHFLDPVDEVYRRILMAGQGFTDADHQAPLYLKTTTEMLEEFSYLGPEKAYEVVIKNPRDIADSVEPDMEPIPQKTYPPSIEGAEEEIQERSWKRAKELYGEPLPDIVKQRLEKELNSIVKNGFSVMYIIAQKLVSKSLSDGYLVGSRGSVGSSFVATMSGITEVNPLPAHYLCKKCKYSEFVGISDTCGCDLPPKNCPNCGAPLSGEGYDIPFETFLGFDGDKEPDIDLNFSGEYQPVVHKYTEELFGVGHVFRAGTIATIADKTAYGFVKKYMEAKGTNANNAEINRLVNGVAGVKRTTGQHPGGVIIVPREKEVYDFCPIQRPADDTDTDIITTHFDYHFIHGTLLKLDILGHDDPTVIRMLEDLTGIDAKTIPIGDPDTMEIFHSTKTLGITPESIHCDIGTFAIPEFGTRFVRQMLIDTKPNTFSELIRISGLSHGTDVWLNNAQDLIKAGTATLKETICTRDDIMLYLLDKGLPPKSAFKIMEAVRKGKGLTPENEELMREHNVPDWYIESCKKIKYMFPKAHAAAYVMMAFRIAYFKVHYPKAFYTTYFSVRADDFDVDLMANGKETVEKAIKEYEAKGNNATAKEKNVLAILEICNEMYARGLKFLPIDLYESDAVKFKMKEDGILMPINALSGLGDVAAKSIVEARKDGEFSTIEDLKVRAKIGKSVVDMLAGTGCLDGIPESNQMSLFG